MVSSTSSTSSSTTTSLSTYYTNLINTTISARKEEWITPLSEQQDTITLKKSIFTDLRGKLTDLQSQVSSLKAINSSSLFTDSRNVSITGQPSGTTILSSTATSSSAEGSYKISDITLAKVQRVTSDKMTASDTALGYNGSIELNGQTINVETTDTLYSITSKINSAKYDSGKEVVASVVDNRLVLESKNSGTENAIEVGGTMGGSKLGLFESGAFKNVLQTASDASFTINGMTVTRSKNTNITDVITGVTLNFASDAEQVGVDSGKTIYLNVQKNADSVKNSVASLVTKYNDLQTYLEQKTTSTKNEDGTYTRGSLSGDLTFRYLRGDLADLIATDASSSCKSKFKNLSEIGISFDNDNKLVIDSSKLSEALENNAADVQSLLDDKMSGLDTLLSQFTGEKGEVTQTLSSLDEKSSEITSQIIRKNELIAAQKELLTSQYATMQETINGLQNTYSTLYAMGLFDLNSSE